MEILLTLGRFTEYCPDNFIKELRENFGELVEVFLGKFYEIFYTLEVITENLGFFFEKLYGN